MANGLLTPLQALRLQVVWLCQAALINSYNSWTVSHILQALHVEVQWLTNMLENSEKFFFGWGSIWSNFEPRNYTYTDILYRAEWFMCILFIQIYCI